MTAGDKNKLKQLNPYRHQPAVVIHIDSLLEDPAQRGVTSEKTARYTETKCMLAVASLRTLPVLSSTQTPGMLMSMSLVTLGA